MRRPLQYVRRRIHSDLGDAGFGDLTIAHLAVFQFPGPHHARPIELAERAEMSKQAMNHLLGELEQRGYLERKPLARGTDVVLTRRGHAAIAAIRATVLAIEAEWAALLGAARFAALRAALVELDRAVSTKPA
jgi:DNA-binding MarR family transcriptional regulator